MQLVGAETLLRPLGTCKIVSSLLTDGHAPGTSHLRVGSGERAQRSCPRGLGKAITSWATPPWDGSSDERVSYLSTSGTSVFKEIHSTSGAALVEGIAGAVERAVGGVSLDRPGVELIGASTFGTVLDACKGEAAVRALGDAHFRGHFPVSKEETSESTLATGVAVPASLGDPVFRNTGRVGKEGTIDEKVDCARTAAVFICVTGAANVASVDVEESSVAGSIAHRVVTVAPRRQR